jgi:integrating conjugative element protein (TIGR03759 family)
MRRSLLPWALCVGLLAPAAALAADARPATTPEAATRNVPTALGAPSDQDFSAVEAARWGLSLGEYQRYQAAIAGLRGRISDPRITPIEVLGIEAHSDAERRRFAERYVEMMLADTEKVLAFSREVQNAWDRLHPGAPLIDLERVDAFRARRGSAHAPLMATPSAPDRLVVFTRTACPECDGKVRQALQAVRSGKAAGADLYVVGVPHGQDEAIHQWARSLEVPAELVNAGTITLNYEDGQLQRAANLLQMSPAALPFVVSRSPEGALSPAAFPGLQ